MHASMGLVRRQKDQGESLAQSLYCVFLQERNVQVRIGKVEKGAWVAQSVKGPHLRFWLRVVGLSPASGSVLNRESA